MKKDYVETKKVPKAPLKHNVTAPIGSSERGSRSSLGTGLHIAEYKTVKHGLSRKKSVEK
jgi:hypothetical protein